MISNNAAAISVANLAEAADRLARIHRIAVGDTPAAVESLQESTDLKLIPVSESDAWRAGT